MQTKKIITTTLLATALLGATTVTATVLVQPNAVQAAATTNVQTRALSKSYVVYGAGASDQSALATTLGVTDSYE